MDVELNSGSTSSSDDTAPDEHRFRDGNMGTFSSPQHKYPSQLLFPFPVPYSSIPLSRELGDYAPDKAKSRKRRSRSSVNARKTEDNKIIVMLAQLIDQMRKQSMQLTESKDDTSEMRKQFGNLTESQNSQSKVLEKLIESQNSQSKVLEKLIESQNGQSKELEKLTASINNYLLKQLEFDTNITGHDESDAPRSQMNQVPPPTYKLVFRFAPTDKIETGKTIKITVALVEANSGQPVVDGPLASTTVELVIVNSKFNQHDNLHNWSREDFERNIVKPRCENSAAGGADQSVKSIVSNGRFSLDKGVGCYSGSAIFENSHNRKVRLAAMTVFPTEERVLEALSNPLLVRDHVQSGKQSNLHHNSSNGQSNMHPNSSNGQRQAQGDNDYQEQNSSMPNLQQPSWPNSTQTGGIRSNIIGGQSQLPFLGSSNMVSSEPFSSQEQQSSIQQYQSPHVPMVAQATYSQNVDDGLAMIQEYLHREDTISMGNDHVLGPAMDTQFPTTMPLQLVWDRPNVGPIKRDWNLLDQLMPLPKFSNCGLPTKCLMQECLVYSRTIMSKEVMQARRNTGVIIEPLEPDDSDDERQLKRKMHSKYEFRFENGVCEGYHIRDPIKADDGNLLKVALFDGNRKITNGPLSSVPVKFVALHGDFNDHGQDYWDSEEFNCCEVCPQPGEEASSVLGGDCILVLSDGEACLGDAFFQMTSYCARTGKFKMGVKLASPQEERIQEGVSESFWVTDRHCPGECGLGIGPEDDTARINHPSVVQASSLPPRPMSSAYASRHRGSGMSTKTMLAAKVAFASSALAAAASFAPLAVPQLVSVAGAVLPRAWAVARFWLVPPYLFVTVHLIILVIWKLSYHKHFHMEDHKHFHGDYDLDATSKAILQKTRPAAAAAPAPAPPPPAQQSPQRPPPRARDPSVGAEEMKRRCDDFIKKNRNSFGRLRSFGRQ